MKAILLICSITLFVAGCSFSNTHQSAVLEHEEGECDCPAFADQPDQPDVSVESKPLPKEESPEDTAEDPEAEKAAPEVAQAETEIKPDTESPAVEKTKPQDKPEQSTPAEVSLRLINFKGNEAYCGGQKISIKWEARGFDGMNAELFVDFFDGSGWRTIWRGEPAEGACEWVVPYINSAECKIRISAEDGGRRKVVTSDSQFTIDSMPPTSDMIIEMPDIEQPDRYPDTKAMAPEPVEEPAVEEKATPEEKPTETIEAEDKPEGEPHVSIIIEVKPAVEVAPAPAEEKPTPEKSRADRLVEKYERNRCRKYLVQGMAAMDNAQYVRAVEQLKLYLKKFPDHIEANYQLGRAYYLTGRMKEAREVLSRLVTIKDDHPGAYYYLGKIDMKTEAHNASDIEYRRLSAKQRFMKAIKLDPKFAAAYNDLGKIYFDEEKFGQAYENFVSATDCDKGNKIFLYNAGRTAFQRGNYVKAIDFCLMAVKIDPQFCYPYWFVAKSYTALGKWDEAAKYWGMAVNLFDFDRRLQSEALMELEEAQKHIDE